jgi:hypothetical protein
MEVFQNYLSGGFFETQVDNSGKNRLSGRRNGNFGSVPTGLLKFSN